MADNTAAPENKGIALVEHPGAFEPSASQAKAHKAAPYSVTVAGSHTVYFDKKPTEKQLEEAQKVGE